MNQYLMSGFFSELTKIANTGMLTPAVSTFGKTQKIKKGFTEKLQGLTSRMKGATETTDQQVTNLLDPRPRTGSIWKMQEAIGKARRLGPYYRHEQTGKEPFWRRWKGGY